MRTCFENLIGIKNCGLENPNTNHYINDMIGITTEMAQKIATSEQKTFVGVFNDSKRNAYDKMKSDLQAKINSKYKLEKVLYNSRKPKIYDKTAVVASGVDTGVEVEVRESKYLELYLKGIWIFSDNTTTTNFFIIDLNDNTQIHTQEIDLIEGFNYIRIDKFFEANYRELRLKLYVIQNFDTVKFLNNDFFDSRGCSTCAYYHGFFSRSFISDIYGYSNGVAFDMEIRCSIEQFMCDNSEQLAIPFKYKIAEQMLMYKMATPHINYFSTGNAENTAYLIDMYKKEYEKAINNFVDSVNVDGEGICFSCDNRNTIQFISMI